MTNFKTLIFWSQKRQRAICIEQIAPKTNNPFPGGRALFNYSHTPGRVNNFFKEYAMSIEKYDFNEFKKEGFPYNFTVVLQDVTNNIKNSFAFHVWVYLLGKPSNWVPNKTEVARHFGCGKTKVDKCFAYLNEYYLLNYEQLRNPNGTIKSTTLICKCGMEFIEKIVNKQTDDTTYCKSSILQEDNHILLLQYTVKAARNNKRIINNKRKRERAKKTRAPLSLDFTPNEENQKLFYETVKKCGIDEQSLKEKFIEIKKGQIHQDWDQQFKLFLLNERPRGKKSSNEPQRPTLRNFTDERLDREAQGIFQ